MKSYEVTSDSLMFMWNIEPAISTSSQINMKTHHNEKHEQDINTTRMVNYMSITSHVNFS